jgi:hypothetical protein
MLLILAGCSSVEYSTTYEPEKIQYTLIYVIHGDANYTYHRNGNLRKADLDALNRAIETARQAEHGEVFIFHQKPERKLLFLFPKKDRLMYHFRHGELIGGESYSPIEGGLKAEANLYNRRKIKSSGRTVFLYFGHEIPSGSPYLVYHQSQPYLQFNTEIFSDDLSLFKDHFNMVVLSTCNNGNPLMAQELSGKADYLVASPQNLHLAHLIDSPLQQLETNPDISTGELANSLARQSFQRLSEFLQTMVTIGVYDLSKIQPQVHSLAQSYRSYLNTVQQNSLFVDNVDCRSLPDFQNRLPQDGITLYYQPPTFGNRSVMANHSGWGCKN